MYLYLVYSSTKLEFPDRYDNSTKFTTRFFDNSKLERCKSLDSIEECCVLYGHEGVEKCSIEKLIRLIVMENYKDFEQFDENEEIGAYVEPVQKELIFRSRRPQNDNEPNNQAIHEYISDIIKGDNEYKVKRNADYYLEPQIPHEPGKLNHIVIETGASSWISRRKLNNPILCAG